GLKDSPLSHDHGWTDRWGGGGRSGIVGRWGETAVMPRSAKLDATALNRLLRDQERVISRAEALTCGMPLHQLKYRIRPGGPWQRLLPGVYLTVTGTPTRAQAEMAALRYAGPCSVITGIAALRRQGIRVRESKIITVLIPSGQVRVSRSFVQVWPTTRMPEFAMADGAIRFALAARAVAD